MGQVRSCRNVHAHLRESSTHTSGVRSTLIQRSGTLGTTRAIFRLLLLLVRKDDEQN